MTERRTAWEIADQMAHAFDPETGEVDLKRWDALHLELSEKAEAVHAVLCRLTAESAACSAESDRLRKRSKAADARASRLRSYMLDCLHRAGLDTLRTHTVTVTRRKGSEGVEVTDLDSLPPEMLRVKREADKRAILEAIRDGADIRGAVIRRGPDSLIIR